MRFIRPVIDKISTVASNRTARLTFGGCMLLIAGALLGYQLWPISIPDTKTETFEQLIAFMDSQSFAELTSSQRREYLDTMAARFTRMMPDEQAEVQKHWKKLPRSRRKWLMRTVEISIGTQLAKQYRDTPAEQRDIFASQLGWMLTASPATSKDAKRWFAGEKVYKALQGDIAKHQRHAYQSSTAEDRALFIDLTRRISKELHK